MTKFYISIIIAVLLAATNTARAQAPKGTKEVPSSTTDDADQKEPKNSEMSQKGIPQASASDTTAPETAAENETLSAPEDSEARDDDASAPTDGTTSSTAPGTSTKDTGGSVQGAESDDATDVEAPNADPAAEDSSQQSPAETTIPAASARSDVGKLKTRQKFRRPSFILKPKAFPERTEGRIQLAFPLAWMWRTDNGYDLFTKEERLGSFGANMEVDVWRIHPRMILSTGATWFRERAHVTDAMSGTLTTWWKADAVTLHVKFRYRVFSWLNVHSRLQAGAEYTKVIVSDSVEHKKYFRKWDGNFLGGIGGGFSLQTPSMLRFKSKIPIFSMGILAEGGYLFGPPADINLDFSGGTANSIDVRAQSLGELSRNTPYLRVDLFLRF